MKKWNTNYCQYPFMLISLSLMFLLCLLLSRNCTTCRDLPYSSALGGSGRPRECVDSACQRIQKVTNFPLSLLHFSICMSACMSTSWHGNLAPVIHSNSPGGNINLRENGGHRPIDMLNRKVSNEAKSKLHFLPPVHGQTG